MNVELIDLLLKPEVPDDKVEFLAHREVRESLGIEDGQYTIVDIHHIKDGPIETNELGFIQARYYVVAVELLH